MGFDDVVFIEELYLRFGDFFGEVEFVGGCFFYLLFFMFVYFYYFGWCVFVGDVVYVIYLIVGQGFNFGFKDVVVFVDVVCEVCFFGFDIGGGDVFD